VSGAGVRHSPAPRGRARGDERSWWYRAAFFCERAAAARPQFRLTTENADAVAGICRPARRYPARPRTRRSARTDAQRQPDRRSAGRLLPATRRRHPHSGSRHQTLRGALDWSYDLLSRSEQAALARLAVFPDRFDVDAAVAVVTNHGLTASTSSTEPTVSTSSRCSWTSPSSSWTAPAPSFASGCWSLTATTRTAKSPPRRSSTSVAPTTRRPERPVRGSPDAGAGVVRRSSSHSLPRATTHSWSTPATSEMRSKSAS